MFLSLGLIVVLALTTSLANGKEYKLIEMSGATPYAEKACADTCKDSMNEGLKLISPLLAGNLATVSFPAGFCTECQLTGLHNFTHKITCFNNPTEDVFDHHFTLTFPYMAGNCKCDLSNNPSEAAKKVNEGKLIEGQCGKENFKNTHTCPTFQCDGNESSDSETVLLNVDLNGAKLTGVLRVDARSDGKNQAYPIDLSLITNQPAEIMHKASEKFDKSWDCLNANHEGLTCHLFSNAPAPFFECFAPANFNEIHALLYTYGQCKTKQ